MPTDYALDFGGESLRARADRSLWWPRQRILFIADVHVGKTRHLALAGLRVPSGSLAADLARLSAAVTELQPRRVIVLGDLFHSDDNAESDQLFAWRRAFAGSFELVRGNHDRFMSDAVLQAGGITVHPEGLVMGPFSLWHHPQKPDAESFRLCGHVHPVYNARGPANDRLRLRCFVIQQQQIILPAYGSFTGGYDVRAYQYQCLIGCSPDAESVAVVSRR